LQSQDFHLLSTTGSCHPARKLKRGELFTDNATTLFRLQWHGYSAHAEAEDGQI
jgi:hypothetical protein